MFSEFPLENQDKIQNNLILKLAISINTLNFCLDFNFNVIFHSLVNVFNTCPLEDFSSSLSRTL